MGKRLWDEGPVIVLPVRLAKRIGLQETIFLQQLHYWLNTCGHIRDGYKWVYNTYEGWGKQFPFWSISTIRRIVVKLEEEKLIVTGNYNPFKMDKTKWYRINYEVLEEIMGKDSEKSTYTEQTTEPDRPEETCRLNQSTIPSDASGKADQAAAYGSLDKTVPKTSAEITPEKNEVKDARGQEENPFRFFEQNGFGTIGGYLADKIQAWCQDLSDELVTEAMKMAVESGIKQWRYVEAILRDWAEKGYETVGQVRAARLKFKEETAQKNNLRSEDTFRHVPKYFELDISAGEDG